MKTIHLRVKSLESTRKITQSMKMVAASKFARAEVVFQKMKGLMDASRFFFDKTKIKLDTNLPNQLIIYITSDRGLCGPAHSGLFRKLRDELKVTKTSYKIVCYGVKGRNLMSMLFSDHYLFVATEAGTTQPIFQDAAKVVDQLIRSDYNYETGRIGFNKYIAKMQIRPSSIPIANFEVLKASAMRNIYQDISDEELRCFSEFLLAMQLYGVLIENYTSVQCSRMMAMDGSSKSAADAISKLKLLYNRTRQATITRELSEIISGKLALEQEE
ncbi:ATP synthase subunit gamma, mitochondrial-like [Ctenocephalides felis]|uniref:ATP synthase subunit gamma, mitochondrial-like n=1 Tax=Ctenocephalides felis TaxID=7515 RepID=UPI000E6E3E4D|nr:ATP synthase subunit gamma, mitochondrial-like [Ctenocephalides felis]